MMEDRPVSGFDDLLDRRQGYITPGLVEEGTVVLSVFTGEGNILGYVHLTLTEFAKCVSVVKGEADRRYSNATEDLPW